MIKINVSNGSDTDELSAARGQSLRDALIEAGYAIDAPCGGSGTCGKCKLHASGSLNAPSPSEMSLLTEAELKSGMRLACQAIPEGDVHIILPVRKDAAILTSSGGSGKSYRPLFSRYGIAVDIGTTTLVLRLISEKGIEATAAMRNPQAAFGSDVVSRMAHALQGHASSLQRIIASALDELVIKAAGIARLDPSAVDFAVITGNTTMLYLLTGQDVTPLSRAPFEADELFGRTVSGGELGIASLKRAQVYLPQCISAFVGADITLAILASDMTHLPVSMLADLGTNGELVLWHKGRFLCTSTAAGPAFEGAEITYGMMAENGAIDSVHIENGSLVCGTIGGEPPVGICGSGIIDAVAAGLELGLIEESGFMPEGDMTLAGKVALTQRDVRQIQLCKSAIGAGLFTLLNDEKVPPSYVVSLFLAGGLGSAVSVRSAAAIGLIPKMLEHRTQPIGNAALLGAEMILRDETAKNKCASIASLSTAIDLTLDPRFTDLYMDGMTIGHLKY